MAGDNSISTQRERRERDCGKWEKSALLGCKGFCQEIHARFLSASLCQGCVLPPLAPCSSRRQSLLRGTVVAGGWRVGGGFLRIRKRL